MENENPDRTTVRQSKYFIVHPERFFDYALTLLSVRPYCSSEFIFLESWIIPVFYILLYCRNIFNFIA